MDQIRERIRIARSEKGWSQGQLGEATGVTQEYVSKVETGSTKRIDVEWLALAASVLGRPLSWFAGVEDLVGEPQPTYGPLTPEQVAIYRAARRLLDEAGLAGRYHIVEAREAENTQLPELSEPERDLLRAYRNAAPEVRPVLLQGAIFMSNVEPRPQQPERGGHEEITDRGRTSLTE